MVLKSNGVRGTVQFIGPLKGFTDEAIGIELVSAKGDCDGSYKGKRLFECKPKHGVFVSAEDIELVKLTK